MPDISGVRAAVRLAQRKLPRTPKNPDPDIGRSRLIGGEDVAPGCWAPDLFGMPPDCPVEPLGMEGDVLYLMDAMGQLAAVLPNALGAKYVQRLFGDRQKYLYWAWPRFSAKGMVENWRNEKVVECLYAGAARRGLFSAADKVRGRGAWRDRHGALIYHSGDALWRTDRKRTREWTPEPTGFIDGCFYPRRPDIAAPWPEPITSETPGNPARTLITALRGWNWERPQVDPVLCLGLIAAAFLGGALPWRPTGFIVGDKSTGKSTLQALFKGVLGDAVVQTADTTAAGIYQRIGQDSLAVAVDEIEADADNRKTMAVIKLARLAASGAMMFRGGQDHTGVEFRAQSTFLFSSINPPPLQPQDVSRMAMLRLKKLDREVSRGAAPTIDADTAGPMLLRCLLDEWHRFDAAFAAYREVLHAGGHDGRGQDTLGVLLACADLALGSELAEELDIPMADDLRPWTEWLKTKSMLEYEDNSENWRACLRHFLTSRVEAWRGGTRVTVGQLLDDLKGDWKNRDPNGLNVRKANEMLAQAGVRVMAPGEIDDDREDGWALAIPNESQLVAAQFKETQWAGVPGASVWKSALRQGPRDVIVVDDRVNRVRINGFQSRCTIVRLKAFEEEGKDG